MAVGALKAIKKARETRQRAVRQQLQQFLVGNNSSDGLAAFVHVNPEIIPPNNCPLCLYTEGALEDIFVNHSAPALQCAQGTPRLYTRGVS